MREDRVLSTRPQRRQPDALIAQGGVTQGIDAVLNPVQPGGGEPVLDLMLCQSRRPKVGVPEQAELPIRRREQQKLAGLCL